MTDWRDSNNPPPEDAGDVADSNVEARLDRLREASRDEQIRILRTDPKVQERVLDALVNELSGPLDAMDRNNRDAFEALADTRQILAGQLAGDLSDERWRRIVDLLESNSVTATAMRKDANEEIGKQANANRIATTLPYLDTVLRIGLQVLMWKR